MGTVFNLSFFVRIDEGAKVTVLVRGLLPKKRFTVKGYDYEEAFAEVGKLVQSKREELWGVAQGAMKKRAEEKRAAAKEKAEAVSMRRTEKMHEAMKKFKDSY